MNLNTCLKWSFLSELASKLIQPLAFLVLARLLTPEDFGVVAAATMIISFSQIFWEAGMGKAIIQYQGDRETAQNTAFWINNGLAIIIVVLLASFSDQIARVIFHNSDVSLVLQVMSFQIILTALTSIHTAVLQKGFHFKTLFYIRLSTVALPATVSIPLALYGWGYWALVAGTLLGQFAQVCILWKISLWKPSLSLDPAIAKKLFHFGGWVAGTASLLWFYSWFDSLIVGYYLGSKDLGVYSTGNQLVVMIYGLLFAPVLPVLYSHFSNIQSNPEQIRRILFRVTKIIASISIPIAFVILANRDFIALVVFGPKWEGVSLVIGILALVHGFSWIVGVNGEAYRSIGAPSQETKIVTLAFSFYLVGYFISIQYGFTSFIWTRFLLCLFALSIHFYVAKEIFDLNIMQCLKHIFFVCLLCSPLSIQAFYSNTSFDLLTHILLAIVSGAYGAFILIALERENLSQILKRTPHEMGFFEMPKSV